MKYRSRKYFYSTNSGVGYLSNRMVGSFYPPQPIKSPSLIKTKSKRNLVAPIEFWTPGAGFTAPPKRRIKLFTL